jgi:hypothetical protein
MQRRSSKGSRKALKGVKNRESVSIPDPLPSSWARSSTPGCEKAAPTLPPHPFEPSRPIARGTAAIRSSPPGRCRRAALFSLVRCLFIDLHVGSRFAGRGCKRPSVASSPGVVSSARQQG